MHFSFVPFRPHRLVAAVALVVTLASGAQGAPLYDNLASGSDGSDPLFSYGPLADSFSTGADGAALGGVLLSLTSLSPAYSGTLSVLLLADAATAPGATLATLGTMPFSAVSTAALAAYAFTPSAPFALDPLTRYWVALTGSAPNAVQWSWSDDLAAAGVAGEYSASSVLGVQANSAQAGPYQMAVLTAPVPEPKTWALMGVGLLALVAGHRARGRRG